MTVRLREIAQLREVAETERTSPPCGPAEPSATSRCLAAGRAGATGTAGPRSPFGGRCGTRRGHHGGGSRHLELEPSPAGGPDRRSGHQSAHCHPRSVLCRADCHASENRSRHGGPDRPGARSLGPRWRVGQRVPVELRFSRQHRSHHGLCGGYQFALRPGRAHEAGTISNRATSHYPAVVLGATAATALGIDRADGSTVVWLGNHWFSVVGILRPLVLAPELDRSALVGFPVAETVLHADGSPVQIYVRTDPTSVTAVQSVWPPPQIRAAPQDAAVANPTDALAARADASAAFQSLFLALGAVALIVGGIGIANVMVIAVLERRGEIGLRRALGARRTHIGVQFVAEAALLAAIGGASGSSLGAMVTAAYATARHWHAVVSLPLLLSAVGLALLVGAAAGLYPALRASRLSPAEALRTV